MALTYLSPPSSTGAIHRSPARVVTSSGDGDGWFDSWNGSVHSIAHLSNNSKDAQSSQFLAAILATVTIQATAVAIRGGTERLPGIRDARTQHWDDFTGINFAPSAPLYSDEDPDVMGPFRNTVDLDPSFNEPIDRFDENLEPFDKTTNPFFDEILEPFYEMYDPFDETADQTIDPTVFWTVEPTVFWTVEHTVDETVDPVMVTAPSVNTTITTVLIVASSSSATNADPSMWFFSSGKPSSSTSGPEKRKHVDPDPAPPRS
ncbi:hypothetical protein C8Q74DRAFT_1370594 [Fomes fomentarius]|nr:hypothetical protein C8Q74DRAFT_1370594 [Fomes fomentarius]